MRRALLACALMTLTALAPLAHGAPACATALQGRLEPLPSLPGLPEGWRPAMQLDESRLPPIPNVVAQLGDSTCDLTSDLPGFARAAGITDPTQLASLAIATSFPDQLGVPVVTHLVLDGGVARAASWSAYDGVRADWTVDLATLRADFVVTEVGAGGGKTTDFEGWHVWVGFSSQTLRDLHNGALFTKTLLVPNADGSQFRLTYFTQFYANEAEADRYAADYGRASQAIWTIQVAQWGFTSADIDMVYDITMDGCSCIFGGNNVNIHVHAKLEDLIRALNLEYPTFQHFYRIVIGHEYHHHLQYSIQQWRLGSALVEGGARFSETIFEPDGAFGPRTIQTLPNNNGFSCLMINPNLGLSRSYCLGLFWGYAYWNNGRIDFLKALYRESLNAQGSGTDNTLPDATDRALRAVGAAAKHPNFEEAYADFAARMLAKDIRWGVADGSDERNWATYLPNATRQAFTNVAGVHNDLTGTPVFRGIVLGDLKGRAGPMVGLFLGDSGVKARWVWKVGTTVNTAVAGGPTVIPDTGITDAGVAATGGKSLGTPPPPTVPGGGFRAIAEAPLTPLG